MSPITCTLEPLLKHLDLHFIYGLYKVPLRLTKKYFGYSASVVNY